jgi:sec-independent protein translocase protein TatC
MADKKNKEANEETTSSQIQQNAEASAFNSILGHLSELRNRLIKSIIAIVVTTLALFPFANELYTWLAQPLMRNLAEQGGIMIATQVASPFLTPFKLSLISGIFLSMPILLYQLWSFVAPGLYQNEKKRALPLLVLSVLLFYGGIAFAYFIVFPIIFAFLSGTAPEGVQVSTDIALYLDFSIKIFFAFGFSFQIPIITILLIISDIVEPQSLTHKRPYVIVGSFIIGMLLTPPDIISQVLLAIPIWILFEIGVVWGKWLKKKDFAKIAKE